MLQILRSAIHMAIAEFIELAIVYHRARKLTATLDNLEGRIIETRNYRRDNDLRWN